MKFNFNFCIFITIRTMDNYKIAYFALIVPSLAVDGSVSPIKFLKSLTALSFSKTAATIGLLLM